MKTIGNTRKLISSLSDTFLHANWRQVGLSLQNNFKQHENKNVCLKQSELKQSSGCFFWFCSQTKYFQPVWCPSYGQYRNRYVGQITYSSIAIDQILHHVALHVAKHFICTYTVHSLEDLTISAINYVYNSYHPCLVSCFSYIHP